MARLAVGAHLAKALTGAYTAPDVIDPEVGPSLAGNRHLVYEH